MKCVLTIQEKLKDLRVDRGLSLEELAIKTGISRAALGSYENNDYKDISHTAIIKLAKFYGVSTDYLLGMTESIEEKQTGVTDLKLDDETIGVLKDKSFNHRLLGEIIKHPGFIKLMCDAEIYVDALAEMQIKNLNSYVAIMRSKIQLQDEDSDKDLYMRTLKECEIDEDDYFSRLIFNDMKEIVSDIKNAHRKDSDTADDYNPLIDALDVVEEYSKVKDPMKTTLATLGKQLGINFNKMSPAELRTFSSFVEKYSTNYKNTFGRKGRGKKSKF